MKAITQEIYKQIDKLPPFPQVAQKVMDLIQEPNTTVEDLVAVIRFDPGVTANVLRLCNSAFFGLPRKVSSLTTAISLLGQKRLFDIIVTTCASYYLKRPVIGYELADRDLWEHSMAAAMAADLIQEEVVSAAKPFSFTTALLHDIGKILLGLFVSEKCSQIITLVCEGQSFNEAERAVLGVDHAELGAEILARWRFPEEIVRAVGNHHRPEVYLEDTLTGIVALANILTLSLGYGVGLDGLAYKYEGELLSRFGLKRRDFEFLLIELNFRTKEAQELFR